MTQLSSYVQDSLEKCYVIPVATVCNADCVFCATNEYKPKTSKEFMDVEGVSDIASMLYEAGVRRFEVTGGGEPNLHPELNYIVDSLRIGGDVKIKLYTNGFKLLEKLNIDELNISRCSIDDNANQHLMKIRGDHKYNFKDLLRLARDYGYPTIRVSVPLIRGGVDTLSEAQRFVEELNGLVDAIVFRPLYPATPQKESWTPLHSINSVDWQQKLSEFTKTLENPCLVEVDVEGCFRAAQLILASDKNLYSNWSLSEKVI